MPTIATNTYRLPILEKRSRGTTIISMSTGNPDVPGNAATLAAFVAAQAALEAANLEYAAIETLARERLIARDNALAAGNRPINDLLGFNEYATVSDREKILGTGFDVHSPRTTPQPVAQILDVQVSFTGHPGYSEV